MIAQAEANAEADKERRSVIESANSADSVCADTEKALGEFRSSLPEEEVTKMEGLIKELRELSTRAQAGEESVTSETIKSKVDETQTASLSLFKKVYEKR